MIDYQPDGISPDNKLLNYQKYFDKIFVFDKDDVKISQS